MGYEIHNGNTELSAEDDRDYDGLVVERDEEGQIILLQKDNLFGTYVHGIFDHEDIAFKLVSKLAENKGVSIGDASFDYQAFKAGEYDKLADIIRENLDMSLIRRLLDLPTV